MSKKKKPFLSSVYPDKKTFFVVTYETGHEDGKEVEICYQTNHIKWAKDYVAANIDDSTNLRIYQAVIKFDKQVE